MTCSPELLISRTSTTARKPCFTDDLSLPFLVNEEIISKAHISYKYLGTEGGLSLSPATGGCSWSISSCNTWESQDMPHLHQKSYTWVQGDYTEPRAVALKLVLKYQSIRTFFNIHREATVWTVRGLRLSAHRCLQGTICPLTEKHAILPWFLPIS